MTFKILTLGCKLNFCDSAAIQQSLVKAGYQPLEGYDQAADVFIVNSCAVTAAAVAKSRHALARARRENPDCVVVLCGCFPQSYPEEAGLKSEADVVVGNSNKSAIPEYLSEFFKRRVKTVKISPMSREFDQNPVPDEDRTRAFIKVQDGCNRFCTYCIIPKARGRTRSLPAARIEALSRACAEHGHREIVLTGINLGCYGKDLGLTLLDAVKAAERSGVERIRLSSLEPELVTDELIEGLQGVSALCPHFHLSLQSGSDEVLKRMARMYNTGQYREVVKKLRHAFSNCSVTTDIIAGFPEETEEEFEETLAFVREIGFAAIHVFPYSGREGTVAAEMPQIHPRIRTRRVEILTDLAKELELSFFKSQVGKRGGVLIEKPQSEEYSHGFTENYTPVRIYGAPIPRHSLVKALITGYREGYCTARVIE